MALIACQQVCMDDVMELLADFDSSLTTSATISALSPDAAAPGAAKITYGTGSPGSVTFMHVSDVCLGLSQAGKQRYSPISCEVERLQRRRDHQTSVR